MLTIEWGKFTASNQQYRARGLPDLYYIDTQWFTMMLGISYKKGD